MMTFNVKMDNCGKLLDHKCQLFGNANMVYRHTFLHIHVAFINFKAYFIQLPFFN